MRVTNVACLLLSLVGWASTCWNLNEYKKEQIKFETTVAAALHESFRILDLVTKRQSGLENIITTSDELRLTTNEIKRYNKNQLVLKKKPQSKQQSIGGE